MFRQITCVAAACMMVMVAQAITAQEPRIFQGHTDPVYTAAFTGDGKTLVSGSFDKSIRLWDVATGASFRTYTGHTGLIVSLDLSADGTRLASGSLDNTIRLWDFPIRTPLAEWQPHPQASLVAVSADGQMILTTGSDQNIRSWNPVDRSQIREFGPTTGRPVALLLRGDKQQAAVLNDQGVMQVFNPSANTPIQLIGAAKGKAVSAFYATDNSYFAVICDDGTIRRYSVPAEPTIVAEPAGAEVLTARASPNGAFIALGLANNQCRLMQTSDGKFMRAFKGHTAPVTSIGWQEDSGRLVTGCADKSVRLFDANSSQLIRSWSDLPQVPLCVGIHPNQQTIVAGLQSGEIEIWNTAEGAKVRTLVGHPGGTTAIAFSPDHQRILSCGADKFCRVWSTADGQQQLQVELPAAPTSLDASWDSQSFAVGLETGVVTLRRYDSAAAEIAISAHAGRVNAISYARDQQRLITAGEDGAVRVWNAANQRLQQFWNYATPAAGCGFGAESTRIVAAARGGNVTIDRVFNQAVHPGVGVAVTAACSHPNPGLYWTGGADGKIKLWEIGGGTVQRTFDAATSPITAMELNLNQQQLAVASANQELQILNANDFKLLAKGALPATMFSLSWSTDSLKLSALGGDQLVRNFDLSPATPPLPAPVLLEAVQVTNGHAAPLLSIAAGAESKSVWTSAADGTVKQWSIARGQSYATLGGHQGAVYAVAWKPDGKFIASGSADKSVKLWSTETNQAALTSSSQTGAIYAAQFSRDGNTLYTAGGDKLVYAYQASDLAIQRKYEGAGDALYSFALFPDGMQVAAVGLDRKIMIWPIGGGVPTKTLTGPKEDLYKVLIHPNGQRLLTIGYGGTIAIWDPAKPEPLWTQRLSTFLYSGAITAAGDKFAVFGNDQRIYLYDFPDVAR